MLSSCLPVVRKKSRSDAARDFILPVCSFMKVIKASSGVRMFAFLNWMPVAGLWVLRSDSTGITAAGSRVKVPRPGRFRVLLWYRYCDKSCGNFKPNGF